VTPQQRELWEMVLLQQEREPVDEGLDTISLTELTLFWDSQDAYDTNPKSIGKETSHEKLTA